MASAQVHVRWSWLWTLIFVIGWTSSLLGADEIEDKECAELVRSGATVYVDPVHCSNPSSDKMNATFWTTLEKFGKTEDGTVSIQMGIGVITGHDTIRIHVDADLGTTCIDGHLKKMRKRVLDTQNKIDFEDASTTITRLFSESVNNEKWTKNFSLGVACGHWNFSMYDEVRENRLKAFVLQLRLRDQTASTRVFDVRSYLKEKKWPLFQFTNKTDDPEDLVKGLCSKTGRRMSQYWYEIRLLVEPCRFDENGCRRNQMKQYMNKHTMAPCKPDHTILDCDGKECESTCDMDYPWLQWSQCSITCGNLTGHTQRRRLKSHPQCPETNKSWHCTAPPNTHCTSTTSSTTLITDQEGKLKKGDEDFFSSAVWVVAAVLITLLMLGSIAFGVWYYYIREKEDKDDSQKSQKLMEGKQDAPGASEDSNSSREKSLHEKDGQPQNIDMKVISNASASNISGRSSGGSGGEGSGFNKKQGKKSEMRKRKGAKKGMKQTPGKHSGGKHSGIKKELKDKIVHSSDREQVHGSGKGY